MKADTVGWQPKNQKLMPDVEAGDRWLATEKPETYARCRSWRPLAGNRKTRNLNQT